MGIKKAAPQLSGNAANLLKKIASLPFAGMIQIRFKGSS